jgi:phosphate transport system protein
MCSLVDEQYQLALRSLEERNIEWAKLIIERDAIVDKYDLKIEKYCQKMVALNQPVAMDLRHIMSALNINSNLERIGDIAVNIVENYLLINKHWDLYQQTKLPEMILIARDMFKNAIDAYINGDPKLAEKVLLADKTLDALNKENHAILIELMKQSSDNIESGIVFLVLSRQIERSGDHATNIAEDVIFIHEATIIRHNYEKLFFEDDDDLD